MELKALHCHCCDNLVLETGHAFDRESFEVVSAHVVVETLLDIEEKRLAECRMHFGERIQVIAGQIQQDWLDQGAQAVKIFLTLRQTLALRLLGTEIAFSNCHLCMGLFVAESVISVCSLLLQYLLVVNRVFVEVSEVGRTCDQAKLVFLVLVGTVVERSLGDASEADYGLDHHMVISTDALAEILHDRLCVVRAFLQVRSCHLDLCSMDCVNVCGNLPEATCFEPASLRAGRRNRCHLFVHLDGHLFCQLSRCRKVDRVR